MDSVEELCENISLVNKSKIVLQGNVADIRANHASDRLLIVTATAPVLDKCNIIAQTQRGARVETLLEKADCASNNEILQAIISQTEVYAFEQQLPTMNDIFIKLVKGEMVNDIKQEE